MTASISYKDIFNASANGVMVTDAAGYLTHINRQAETILGFSAHRNSGDFISDLMPLTGPQVMACMQSGEPNLGHLIKGKTVDLVLFITPVFDNQGRLHIVVVNERDMTQLDVIREELEQTQMVTQRCRTPRELSAALGISPPNRGFPRPLQSGLQVALSSPKSHPMPTVFCPRRLYGNII